MLAATGDNNSIRTTHVKIGFYDDYRPCVIKDNQVIDISAEVGAPAGFPPQALLELIINNFANLRGRIEKASAKPIPLDKVKLRAPVPRPGKVLCGERNYMEGVPLDPPGPMKSFFKSPDAVIGPGEDVILPAFKPTVFNHEAELGIVIGKTAKNIGIGEALNHVFGYTTCVDVSARRPAEGEADLPGSYGKCFDTFLPVGPWIVTADEIKNPNSLQVRYRVNGEVRQNYNTSDMEHGVPFFIATLSHCMTLKPGDLLLAGTNHAYLGPLQDGDQCEIEIDGIGVNPHRIKDPYKRSWKVVLRDPKQPGENRHAMREKHHPGTWPFKAVGGQPASGGK